VKFFNNLLSDSELEFVDKTITRDHWGFGYISTDKSKPIWNFDKQAGKPVAELIASKLKGYKLDDWHINGQTFGLDGSPHTDSYSGCSHAFVFFIQDWEYTWGGRLHIFKDNPVVITPEKNFGVLFDANLLHYAEAPLVPILRISIGLKLNELQ
jgi:hypothetical protein